MSQRRNGREGNYFKDSKSNRSPGVLEHLEERCLLAGTFNALITLPGGATVPVSLDGNVRTVFAERFTVTRDLLSPGTAPGLADPGEAVGAFCIDLTQGISSGMNVTYNVDALTDAPSPGPAMTPAQAHLIEELYGRFNAGVGNDTTKIAGFQVALWELSHDTDLNVSTGRFHLTSGADAAIVTQAQAYINALNGQGPFSTLSALVSPDVQDVIFEVPGTTPSFAPASLSGHVYYDVDNNGLFQTSAGDQPIAGAAVTLSGNDVNGNAVSAVAITDINGAYAFNNLQPAGAGGYKLTETQPAAYDDGKDTIGSQGGVSGNDVFSQIPLVSGQNGINNDFGELLEVGPCDGGTSAISFASAASPAQAKAATAAKTASKAKAAHAKKPVHAKKPAHHAKPKVVKRH
jgi:hypothetical protein